MRSAALTLAGWMTGSVAGLLLGGAAAAADVAAVGAGDGRVEVREGAAVLGSFAPRTPVAARGTPVARSVTVDGRRVVEVRIPIRQTARQEVWVAQLGPGAPQPIWWDVAGARDADGET